MIDILKTTRTLIGYLLCGTLFIIPLLLFGIAACFGSSWGFNVIYMIDITICSICHGTMLESISGRSYRLSNKKRYHYQMIIIDWLLLKIDGSEHCKRSYEWESKIIRIKR